jgi:predicted DNA-binding protein YlxM (UPF0122 family)
MARKIKVRDKYWDEKSPNHDLDFVEVFLSPSDIDAFIREHAERFVRNSEIDESTILVDRKRKEQMMEEIYKAASSCLTNRQFQIFILRYKFGFLEVEIARQVDVIQPYVSNTLKVCHKKIRRFLKLEIKAKRKHNKKVKNAAKKQDKPAS